jgi:hypothetical protein
MVGQAGPSDNIYTDNVVIKIQNGTVRSDKNMCSNCRYSHHTIGATTGRETVFCVAVYNHTIRLTEPVAKCNLHSDKTTPTLEQMNDIAWTLMTNKQKVLGFLSPEELKNKDVDKLRTNPGFLER